MTTGLPAVLANLELQTLLEQHAARILEPGERVAPAGSTLYGTHLERSKFNHPLSSRETLAFELPFPRAPENYDAGTRNKFFPELRGFETKLNEELGSGPSLDPLTVYCQKTGQPIGPIDVRVLEQTLEIIGHEELAEHLFLAPQTGTHPAWIKTASKETYNERLDRLCSRDPRAYAVYCFGLMTNTQANKKRENLRQWASQRWALARAWAMLETVPREQLAELCDALCHLLSYAPISLTYLNRLLGGRIQRPDTLALKVVQGELTRDVETAIERLTRDRVDFNVQVSAESFTHIRAQKLSAKLREALEADLTRRKQLKQAGRTDDGSDPYHVGELQGKLSKFRDEQRTKNELMRQFGGELFGVAVTSVTITTIAARLKARVVAQETAPSQEITGNFDLSDIDATSDHFGDAGEDVVEMRTIPREVLLERYETERTQAREAFAAREPVMTLAERLAQREATIAAVPVPVATPQLTGLAARFAAREIVSQQKKGLK